MHIIGVLLTSDSTGLKPDLSFVLIDALDIPHNPFAFSDLVFYASGLRIIQVKVVPAVPFRHPDNFVCIIEEMAELLKGIIDKSVALFINNSTCFTGVGIHTYQPKYLMSSLVVNKSETARIRRPTNPDFVGTPGIGEKLIRDGNVSTMFNIEQFGLVNVNTVAGLGIGGGM